MDVRLNLSACGIDDEADVLPKLGWRQKCGTARHQLIADDVGEGNIAAFDFFQSARRIRILRERYDHLVYGISGDAGYAQRQRLLSSGVRSTSTLRRGCPSGLLASQPNPPSKPVCEAARVISPPAPAANRRPKLA